MVLGVAIMVFQKNRGLEQEICLAMQKKGFCKHGFHNPRSHQFRH
jgi:hypothetical protein